MKWKCKALLQNAFSNIPFGEYLNYIFQRYISKSLPTSELNVLKIVSMARENIEVLSEYSNRQIQKCNFYEFGAGWDLIIPLAFYTLGVKHQIIVDIRNLQRRNLVNDTIDKLQRIPNSMGGVVRKPNFYLPNGRTSLSFLNEYYGIKYIAPCDARNTNLSDNSIDIITSTNTLEHIPRKDIQDILRECYRLLKDDGLMCFCIDYGDHYSYFDGSISIYNFLQYSDRRWALFNPALHYQNRLRHRDYIKIFQNAGFEIVDERRIDGTAVDLETIEKLSLDKRFKSYTTAELAVRNSRIILRKQNRVVPKILLLK